MTGKNGPKTESAEIDFRFADAETMAELMNVGVRRALADHKRIGNPVAVWDHEKGEVRILLPEEIPMDEDEAESGSTQLQQRRIV